MAKRFIRKLQKFGTHSYVVVVPKELIRTFGWKERQKVEIISPRQYNGLYISTEK